MHIVNGELGKAQGLALTLPKSGIRRVASPTALLASLTPPTSFYTMASWFRLTPALSTVVCGVGAATHAGRQLVTSLSASLRMDGSDLTRTLRTVLTRHPYSMVATGRHCLRPRVDHFLRYLLDIASLIERFDTALLLRDVDREPFTPHIHHDDLVRTRLGLPFRLGGLGYSL